MGQEKPKETETGQEKPAEEQVVAVKTCQKAMREPGTAYNTEIRMQCQDKSVEHGVGENHLNVEFRAPTNPDPKMAYIAAACKSGNLNACTINVVPKSPEAERGK